MIFTTEDAEDTEEELKLCVLCVLCGVNVKQLNIAKQR